MTTSDDLTTAELSARTATIKALSLSNLLADGALFVSADRSRPILHAVMLSYRAETKMLRADATDSFWLIRGEEACEGGPNEDWSVLVPLEEVKVVLAALKPWTKTNPEVSLTVAEGNYQTTYLTVSLGNAMSTRVTCQPGQFPAVERFHQDVAGEPVPVGVIGLNPALMVRLVKLSSWSKAGSTPVRLTFFGQAKAAGWSVGERHGLVMPVRLSDK